LQRSAAEARPEQRPARSDRRPAVIWHCGEVLRLSKPEHEAKEEMQGQASRIQKSEVMARRRDSGLAWRAIGGVGRVRRYKARAAFAEEEEDMVKIRNRELWDGKRTGLAACDRSEVRAAIGRRRAGALTIMQDRGSFLCEAQAERHRKRADAVHLRLFSPATWRVIGRKRAWLRMLLNRGPV
jgi:hypothetical protein